MTINPVSVNIVDDDIHEDSENFFGILTAPGQPAILNPDRRLITIMDDNDRRFFVRMLMLISKLKHRQQSQSDLSELSTT